MKIKIVEDLGSGTLFQIKHILDQTSKNLLQKFRQNNGTVNLKCKGNKSKYVLTYHFRFVKRWYVIVANFVQS